METQKKKVITKKSVGIILFSHDYKKVLLVQKRNTYSFLDFITGKYIKTNKKQIQKMFNTMTVYEKSIILSANFEYIWYYAFLTHVKTEFYYKCLNKFMSFMNDNGRFFKNLILNSGHVDTALWEAPKGRKTPDESNITCAMRELEEETSYNPNDYNFIFNIHNNKYKNIYIENNIRYNIIYYVAKLSCKSLKNGDPNINKLVQMNEIINIKWVNVSALDKYTMVPELKTFIKNMYNKLNAAYITHYTRFDE